MIVEIAAREDLLAAVIWYEDQRERLGLEFLAAVDNALARVVEAPDSFPRDRFYARARRALVSRFPYAVVFVVQEGEVRIVAFAHAKRLPAYWMTGR